jgi:hypothetical protein
LGHLEFYFLEVWLSTRKQNLTNTVIIMPDITLQGTNTVIIMPDITLQGTNTVIIMPDITLQGTNTDKK